MLPCQSTVVITLWQGKIKRNILTDIKRMLTQIHEKNESDKLTQSDSTYAETGTMIIALKATTSQITALPSRRRGKAQ